jgi:hypothetical protein
MYRKQTTYSFLLLLDSERGEGVPPPKERLVSFSIATGGERVGWGLEVGVDR